MNTKNIFDIQSRDYWFKIVDFLQQNWALIELSVGGTGCTVFFFGDTSGVFDKLEFTNAREAKASLLNNGFSRFSEDKHAQGFIALPQQPFYESIHPNGNIYSSGRFWDSTLHNRGKSTTKRPRATVILKMESKILLTETHSGLVLLPGGGLKRGELSIAAAARELHEETGLVATKLVSLFNYESETTYHNVFYAVAYGTPIASDDAVRIHYLEDSATTSKLNLSPATRIILEKFSRDEATRTQ